MSSSGSLVDIPVRRHDCAPFMFGDTALSPTLNLCKVAGTRPNSREMKNALGGSGAQIVALTESIGQRAMHLIDQYALVNGLRLGDALIAATAIEHGLTLLTANLKHFGSIAGLVVERIDPLPAGP